jgi:hypothetical protein
MQRGLVGAFVSAAVLSAGMAAAQDQYNIHFQSAEATSPAGGLVSLALAIDNQPEAVTALSFGVKHDAAKLTVDAVEIASALQAALGAGTTPDDRFYSLDLSPDGGAGFTVAVIIGADSVTGKAIPAGLDQPIFTARYRIALGITGETDVEITGDLGAPKVPVLLDRKGVSQPPVGTPAPVTKATVTITAGPAPFLRGDANQSGSLDVTDGIIIINYLFGGGSLPAGEATRTSCLVAMNVDGSTVDGVADVEDGPDIDLTDAIVLLQYVFQRGPAPAAPFPDCGAPVAPVAPEADCSAFICK